MTQQDMHSPSGVPAAPPEQPKKGLGIAAMVLGIIALVFGFIPFIATLSFVLGPLAVVLGIIAFIKRRGRGQGIAGVITGAIGTVVALIGFVLTGAFIAAVDEEVQNSEGTTNEAEEAEPAIEDDGADTDGAASTEEEAGAEQEEDDAEASGDTGSRENPLPIGDTFEAGDWTVTINSFTPNADDEIAAENQFNDPAPEGHSYALINADATYSGDDSEMVMTGVSIDYVTSSGETSGSSDAMAVAPDALQSSAELFEGGTESGNVALVVPEDDDGLIRVRLGMFDREDAFFTAE